MRRIKPARQPQQARKRGKQAGCNYTYPTQGIIVFYVAHKVFMCGLKEMAAGGEICLFFKVNLMEP